MKRSTLFTLLFFVLLSPLSYSKELDRVRAVIGSTPVLQSDVENRLNLIKSSPVYSNILGLDSQKIQEDGILDLIIEEQIITAVTEELNAPVADVDVQKQIDQIAKQNNISRDQLLASLKSEGIPFEAYASNIRNQLQKRAIFERELRSSNALSEAELRKEYYKMAKSEYELLVLEAPSRDHKKILDSFQKRESKWDDLNKKYPTTELGWIQPENLKSDLAQAIAKSSTGELIGPYKVGERMALIFVSAERRGSDEEFETVKERLAAQLQSVSFNDRFRAWLDSKKKTMQIVVNK